MQIINNIFLNVAKCTKCDPDGMANTMAPQVSVSYNCLCGNKEKFVPNADGSGCFIPVGSKPVVMKPPPSPFGEGGPVKLKAIEVCEIAQIEVNGVVGQNLIDAAFECVYLVNLLKVAVKLYWNGVCMNVYKSTTAQQIIEQITGKSVKG